MEKDRNLCFWCGFESNNDRHNPALQMTPGLPFNVHPFTSIESYEDSKRYGFRSRVVERVKEMIVEREARKLFDHLVPEDYAQALVGLDGDWVKGYLENGNY